MSASQLPTELITYILELASNSVTPTPRPWRYRNALLARLAIVCRSWRYPAQEILWRQVEIRSDNAARAFVAASGSGRRTLQLRDVESAPPVDAMQLDEVIRACVGLKSVGLYQHVSSVEALCVPSMASVTWLSISLPSTPCSPPIVFPFALKRLTLKYCPDTPKAVHAAVLQSSITSLDLDVYTGYNAHLEADFDSDAEDFHAVLKANILDELKHIAPQLVSLALCSDQDLTDHLDDFLRLCTRLENFSTEYVEGLRDRLKAIPVPIQRWTVQWAMNGALKGVREALEADIPALAKLKFLVLDLGRDAFEDEDGGIEKACRARGVKLELVK